MPYFTSTQIAKAKEIDLLTYLQNYNPDELVYDSRNAFHTRTHDSLKISNGMWYWFSRGIGGKTALEYLIKVEEYSFTEAVEHLINQKGLEKRHIPKKERTEKKRTAEFELPKKSFYNDKVIYYLRSRGISKNIIDECINKGLIYQDYPKSNIVFVGLDDNNIPKYAGIRSTNFNRFMYDAGGSDKAYSFRLKSVSQNNTVHLFESAIDLLSYATLKELKKEQWNEENLLSLAGVYNPGKDVLHSTVPTTVTTFLKNNSNIDTIFLHFDNDEAGRIAAKAIQISLSGSYKIIDEPPKKGKDFNDFLCETLKISKKKGYKNCR